ncbi:hypothetical protein SDC9_90751 [bioreactor metagenome]|uniref:Uncharacterized protein n=1 Tax=bioreactor metagenome TaxID=1076179 RepID=A0A644ZZN2_9ZZZZ
MLIHQHLGIICLGQIVLAVVLNGQHGFLLALVQILLPILASNGRSAIPIAGKSFDRVQLTIFRGDHQPLGNGIKGFVEAVSFTGICGDLGGGIDLNAGQFCPQGRIIGVHFDGILVGCNGFFQVAGLKVGLPFHSIGVVGTGRGRGGLQQRRDLAGIDGS